MNYLARAGVVGSAAETGWLTRRGTTAEIEVKILKAKPKDAEDIAKMHVAAWRSAYQGLLDQSMLDALDVDDRTRMWAQILENQAWPVYLAIDNNEAVGFIHLSGCRDPDLDAATTGEIVAMYLHPSHQRKGYGARLIARAIQEFSELGFTEASLWVLAENSTARVFYEHCGFAADGEHKLHPSTQQIELRYRRQGI